MLDLSIVIITLNEETRLPRLLDDLKCQSWQGFEIIHVDSQSTDRTVEVSKRLGAEFDLYHVVEMQERGVSLGRNTGASYAASEKLLFLDAGTRLGPTFLERAMAELKRRDLEVGIVCMDGQGGPLRHRFGFAVMNIGIRLTSAFFPTAVGACLFSEREIHDEIGGFDERLELCEGCNYVLKASQAPMSSLGVLSAKFSFDPGRLRRDGFLRTGLTYLRANIHRYFHGELFDTQISYKFGHYR